MKRTAVILGIAAAMGVFVPLAGGSSNYAPGVALEWGTGAQPVYVVSTSQRRRSTEGEGHSSSFTGETAAPRSSSGSTRSDRAARIPFLVMGRAFGERHPALTV